MAMGCPHQGRSGGLNATITSRPLTHRGPHRWIRRESCRAAFGHPFRAECHDRPGGAFSSSRRRAISRQASGRHRWEERPLRGSMNASSPSAGSQAHTRKTSIIPIRSASTPRPAAASPPKPNASP